MKRILGIATVLAALAAPGSWAQSPTPRAHTAVIVHMDSTYLGIGVADIDSERAKTLKLKEDRGAEVTSVTPDSPAAKAGMKAGDVVLEYNGQAIEGKEELQRLVHETPSGRQVKILVWRAGAPLTLAATIEQSRNLPQAFNWPFDGATPMQPMQPMPPMPPMQPMQPMQPFDIPRIMTAMQSGVLGILGEPLGQEDQLAEFFGVKDGVLVKSVLKGSPAEKGGLKAGDVIVRVGDAHISNTRDITNALRASRGPSPVTVTVTVMRDRKETPVAVTIEYAKPYGGLLEFSPDDGVIQTIEERIAEIGG